MKKKILLMFIIILIVLILIWGYQAKSKHKNYNERGTPVSEGLVGGKEAWYNNVIFEDLSTIAENSDYGTFVFKKNGDFVYFPSEKDALTNKISNVYRYDGIWYKHYQLRLTVTKRIFNRRLFNISFKDDEFFLYLGYNWDGDMTFDENLIINGKEFVLLNNELTENIDKKLRMDDEVIEKFIKNFDEAGLLFEK
jgi:signal peptidase I